MCQLALTDNHRTVPVAASVASPGVCDDHFAVSATALDHRREVTPGNPVGPCDMRADPAQRSTDPHTVVEPTASGEHRLIAVGVYRSALASTCSSSSRRGIAVRRVQSTVDRFVSFFDDRRPLGALPQTSAARHRRRRVDRRAATEKPDRHIGIVDDRAACSWSIMLTHFRTGPRNRLVPSRTCVPGISPSVGGTRHAHPRAMSGWFICRPRSPRCPWSRFSRSCLRAGRCLDQ